MFVLRPRQEKLRNDIRKAFENGKKRILAVAPCAFGKTPTSAKIIEDAKKRNSTVLFIVPREELLDQCSNKLDQLGVEHGVLLKGHPKTNPIARVQLSSWQTLTRKIKNPNFTYKPNLIIYDEAHRSVAPKSIEILLHFNTYTIGFTATPYRDDSTGLDSFYDEMIVSCNAVDLINEGLLIKPDYFKIESDIVISSESTVVLDDFSEKSLEDVEHDIVISADLVRNYQQICKDKQAVIFCRNVEHAKEVVEKFRKAKISAEFVECHTKNRKQLLESFENKKFKILACASLLAEGWDYPDLEVVILFRKMGSRALFRQASNRCMRIAPNKKGAIILDFFDNYSDHGYPWSTEVVSLNSGLDEKKTREKKQKEDEENENNTDPTTLVMCLECKQLASRKINAKKCQFCNAELPPEKLPKITVEVKNDLKKLDESTAKRVYTLPEKQEEYNNLCLKCMKKSLKPSWVAAQYKGKFGVWPRNIKKSPEFIKYELSYSNRQQNKAFISEQLKWELDV